MNRYYLFVPISSDFDYSIHQFEVLNEIKINSFDISIKNDGPYSYLFTLGPFELVSEAEDYYPKLKSLLFWLSLKCKIGIKFPNNVYFNKLSYLRQNSESDAFIVEGKEAPERFKANAPSSTVTPSSRNIISTLSQCFSFNKSEKVLENKKLKLALELYSNYFFERSKYAKFISLVNILEALSPSLGDEKISNFSKSKLLEIIEYANNIKDIYDKKSQEYNELESLINRINDLENKGTTGMVLRYIKEMVKNNPSLGEPKKISLKINEAYDLRSKLLHGDEIDSELLGQKLSFLSSFIPMLLEAIYIKYAN